VIQTHPERESWRYPVAVRSAQKTAIEHGIPAYYTDFEEMLDREKPDIVSIVTPPTEHFRMVRATLDRRIHTLCEKPFAMNLADAREMKRAADEVPGVVAMIDFEFRDLPGRAFAAELVRQGYIGKLRMADLMVHLGTRSRAEDVVWDWWSDRSAGGGELGAVGSHTADMFWIMEVARDDSFVILSRVRSRAQRT
jgi:predicted dehydrogenase